MDRDRAGSIAAAVAVGAALLVAAPFVEPHAKRAGRGPEPRSLEDALVQQRWRESAPGAHVGGCTPSGAADVLLGGEVWACDLWYLSAADAKTVCVSIQDRVVQRRISGTRPGRLRVSCA